MLQIEGYVTILSHFVCVAVSLLHIDSDVQYKFDTETCHSFLTGYAVNLRFSNCLFRSM